MNKTLLIILIIFITEQANGQTYAGKFMVDNSNFGISLDDKYAILNYSARRPDEIPRTDSGTYILKDDSLTIFIPERIDTRKLSFSFDRIGFHTRRRNNLLLRVYFFLPSFSYREEKYHFEKYHFANANLFVFSKANIKLDSMIINPWAISKIYEILLPKSAKKIKMDIGHGVKGEYQLPKGFNEFNIAINLNQTGMYGREKYTKCVGIKIVNDTLSITGMKGYAVKKQ